MSASTGAVYLPGRAEAEARCAELAKNTLDFADELAAADPEDIDLPQQAERLRNLVRGSW
ncbi:hypothetical protein [Nocardia wallacei]|uniref:hypothetical protein n=1 Tax=Nocardia wallacei TaxID=480035 RepID=UPI002458A8A4|nr:hypothetical protein [Nocardia wallacei]